MNRLYNNKYIIGFLCTLASFVLLVIGVRFISGNIINFDNLIAYLVFSSIVGGVIFLLIHLKLKVAFFISSAGLGIGFFEMYRAFLSDMAGWGDLIGVLSLLMWTAGGIVAALLIQIAYYLYRKFRRS